MLIMIGNRAFETNNIIKMETIYKDKQTQIMLVKDGREFQVILNKTIEEVFEVLVSKGIA